MCEREGKIVVPKKPIAGMLRFIGDVLCMDGRFCRVNILRVENPEYAGQTIVTHCLPEDLIEFDSEKEAMDHLAGKGVALAPVQ
jgi:hypothetical protein